MSDSLNRDPVTCPCCGVPKTELRKNVWVSEPVCQDCIIVWYDEVAPRANPDDYARDIRRASRSRQGLTLETYEP